MIRLEVNDGTYDTELYFETGTLLTNVPAAIREIRGYVSEFKTYCIVNKKPYNIPHFINWMNKYTKYEVGYGIPRSGRIDF